MLIREINPTSKDEIQLVASRMRKTLIDVLGTEKGQSLYTEDWLKERVQWHLSPDREATILLAESDRREISAQAIARVEVDEKDSSYGYFSTIYVAPEYRRQGIAQKLIQQIIDWCHDKNLPYVIYNTAEGNEGLIKLYKKLGFKVSLKESAMVQLKKLLS